MSILKCIEAGADIVDTAMSPLEMCIRDRGRDEWIPEGQAMRDYLIEKGLPADRVLAENKSTSTEERCV